MPVKVIDSFLDHRFMLLSLTVHDFRNQYLDSILGFLWALIKPLVMVGIYVVVFSAIVPPEKGLGNINFGLYVFAGMLPWLAVQESLSRGATVMHDFANLVRHHAIPLYLLPFHIVLSATVSSVLTVLVFIALKVAMTGNLSIHSFLILAVLPFQVLFCFGLTLFISTITVFVLDTQHFTSAMLTVWFFASPIVFPREALPPILQNIWINPFISLTSIYRDLLLFGKFPGQIEMLAFLIFAATACLIGSGLYLRTNHDIVDWI